MNCASSHRIIGYTIQYRSWDKIGQAPTGAYRCAEPCAWLCEAAAAAVAAGAAVAAAAAAAALAPTAHDIVKIIDKALINIES